MGYSAGETVIVTRDEVNHVGVVLDRYVVLKHVVYDVLLENRSAMVMITKSSPGSGKTTFIKYMKNFHTFQIYLSLRYFFNFACCLNMLNDFTI